MEPNARHEFIEPTPSLSMVTQTGHSDDISSVMIPESNAQLNFDESFVQALQRIRQAEQEGISSDSDSDEEELLPRRVPIRPVESPKGESTGPINNLSLPFRHGSPTDPMKNVQIPSDAGYKPLSDKQLSQARQLKNLQDRFEKGKIKPKNYFAQVRSILS